MKRDLNIFSAGDNGATVIEYAFVAILISIVIYALVVAIGNFTPIPFSQAGSGMDSAR